MLLSTTHAYIYTMAISHTNIHTIHVHVYIWTPTTLWSPCMLRIKLLVQANKIGMLLYMYVGRESPTTSIAANQQGASFTIVLERRKVMYRPWHWSDLLIHTVRCIWACSSTLYDAYGPAHPHCTMHMSLLIHTVQCIWACSSTLYCTMHMGPLIHTVQCIWACSSTLYDAYGPAHPHCTMHMDPLIHTVRYTWACSSTLYGPAVASSQASPGEGSLGRG